MRFAIVGDPVDHSRSPAIHNAAFAALGIDATYDFLRTPADSFAEVVDQLRSGALTGVNVTMPLKAAAFEAVDIRSPLAERTRAVNTITKQGSSLFGTNTDVAGVEHAFNVTGVPDDSALLLLGAGSAAGAAVVAAEGRPLFVSSRSPASGEALLSRTGATGVVVPWGEGVAGSVVVNATPLGMHGESLPLAPLATCAAFIDMTYGTTDPPSVALVRGQGLPVADGLDMLVGQALEAFTVFTGRPAPAHAIESAARMVT